jgi:DnaJ-class molecular chaperone
MNISEKYRVLGLNPGVPLDTVKKNYKKLALKYHPDRPSGDTIQFQKISDAYNSIEKYETDKTKMKRVPQWNNNFPSEIYSNYDEFNFVFNNGRFNQPCPTSVYTEYKTTIRGNKKISIKTQIVNGVKTTIVEESSIK